MSRTAVLYQEHLILELPDEFAELNADSFQKYFTGDSPDIVYAWDEKKGVDNREQSRDTPGSIRYRKKAE